MPSLALEPHITEAGNALDLVVDIQPDEVASPVAAAPVSVGIDAVTDAAAVKFTTLLKRVFSLALLSASLLMLIQLQST